MSTDQRNRGLGEGGPGHRQQDAQGGAEAHAGDGSPPPETVDPIMLGIVSVGAHETLEAGGRRTGFQMGVVNSFGDKYFVEVSQEIFEFLSQLIINQEAVPSSPELEEETPPTGSEEEIAMMQQLLTQAERAEAPAPSLGVVSGDDDGLVMPVQSLVQPPNPVDELLSMVPDADDDFSEYDDDDDDDDQDFGEDVGQL